MPTGSNSTLLFESFAKQKTYWISGPQCVYAESLTAP